MKKMVGKIISTLLLMSILLMTIPLSVSAGGFSGYDDVSASGIVDIINDFGYGNMVSTGSAELDTATNTVKLLSDIGPWLESEHYSLCYFDLWINNLTEDITIDLNGYTIYNSHICLDDDDYNTITFKDSLGGGKIIGAGAMCPGIMTSGKINLVIESGIYMGGDAFEWMDLNEPETIMLIDSATSALLLGGEVSVDIKGGTFIGGNGLNRQEIDERFIENAAAAISIESEKIKDFKISENVIVKGGGGDNVAGGAGIKIGSEAVVNAIEINGAQITGGNGTVGGDAIYSDVAVNLKLTDVTLTAGAPNGKEINVPNGSNVDIVKTPTTVDYTEQGVNVKAADGVFPKNTSVKVTTLTQGDMVDKANIAFGEKYADFRLYDISAKLNNSAVQPNGEVVVTFDIPESFNMQKTGVYYIDGNGASQKLESEINTEKRTITAKLTHFSAYAVVDESVKQTAVSSSAETVSDTSTSASFSEASNTSEQTASSEYEVSNIDDTKENISENYSSEDAGTSFYETQKPNNKIVIIIGIAALVSCLLAVGVIVIIKSKSKNIEI